MEQTTLAYQLKGIITAYLVKMIYVYFPDCHVSIKNTQHVYDIEIDVNGSDATEEKVKNLRVSVGSDLEFYQFKKRLAPAGEVFNNRACSVIMLRMGDFVASVNLW